MNSPDFGLNVIASQEIYKDFISGKIINKYELIDDRLLPSKKFSALISDIDTYRSLYILLGFDLVAVGNEAYFATRKDRADLNDTGANIQVLLIVLCRGLTARGIAPAIMQDPSGGISAKDIDAIGEDEEISRIVKACGLLLPLIKPVTSILVDRGIMHKTLNERYILSCAGTYLYNRLFDAAE